MTSLLPTPELQLFSDNGTPLAGGTINTFVPGTTTPKPTYQDATKTVANANPIILDGAGRCIAFGDGDFRFVVKDSSGNLVYDQLTSAALPDDAISGVMLPVTGAATLATARDLMGVTDFVNTSVASIHLMTGPTGPTGPVGATGPAGGSGPTGSGYAPAFSQVNPGYVSFPSLNGGAGNLFIQFGNAATDDGGNANVTFTKPFPNAVLSVVATAQATSWWINITASSNSSFSAVSSSPLHGGGWQGGPMGFFWIGIGW